MKMVFPSLEYKDKAMEYINEFHEYDSDINGTGNLDQFLKESSYEKWLESLMKGVDMANLSDAEVPRLTYFYIREEDEKIVGMVNIRLGLNDFLRAEGGHIGYSVRPTERHKHYATMMLKDALKVCDKIGIKEVLISCDKVNVASAGVIEKCGGTLKNEFYSETYGEILTMYQINR